MMDIILSIEARQRSSGGVGFITMTTTKSWEKPVQRARNVLQMGCFGKKGIISSLKSWTKTLQNSYIQIRNVVSNFDVYSIETFLFTLTSFFISLTIYIFFD